MSIFEASGSTLDEKVSTVIVGVVQLVATVVSMFLVDRAGRRLLLLFSGLFMTVSLAAMGSFFYLKVPLHPKLDQFFAFHRPTHLVRSP